MVVYAGYTYRKTTDLYLSYVETKAAAVKKQTSADATSLAAQTSRNILNSVWQCEKSRENSIGTWNKIADNIRLAINHAIAAFLSTI